MSNGKPPKRKYRHLHGIWERSQTHTGRGRNPYFLGIWVLKSPHMEVFEKTGLTKKTMQWKHFIVITPNWQHLVTANFLRTTSQVPKYTTVLIVTYTHRYQIFNLLKTHRVFEGTLVSSVRWKWPYKGCHGFSKKQDRQAKVSQCISEYQKYQITFKHTKLNFVHWFLYCLVLGHT